MAARDVGDVVTTVSVPEVTSSSTAGAGAVLRCDTPELLATVITLGGVILATIVGNVFVIAAVVLERHLRSHVANYLVASLAVADLLVALLVMPLAVVNEVCRRSCVSAGGTHSSAITNNRIGPHRTTSENTGISKL